MYTVFQFEIDYLCSVQFKRLYNFKKKKQNIIIVKKKKITYIERIKYPRVLL